MTSAEIEVVNVVAVGMLEPEVDIQQIAEDAPTAVANYDPEFNAAFLRLNEDGPLLILYTSGSYILRGVPTYDAVQPTIDRFLDTLSTMGVPLGTPTTTVKNVVATADLDQSINLNALITHLGFEHTEYEPEQFPGVVYRPTDSPCVLLIFATGNTVITGGTHPDDNQASLDALRDELDDLCLAY
jgi:transcription initiation factor TFIID TATA-box-binding protein